MTNRRLLCAFLACMMLLPALSAGAFAAQEADSTDDVAAALQEIVDNYFWETGVSPDLVSVGYVCPETGTRWYYNEDRAYYSASLYKVPLMMLLAEKEAAGELTQESEIYGMPLSEIEEQVLVWSNNDLAYSMLWYFGEPSNTRRMFQRYSDLPDEAFDWEFVAFSYFTAAFMTDVMETLYTREENFPHVLERLCRAQPEHYFRLKLEGQFEIAQKYGYDVDADGNAWTHTAGVIYTPTPFILVVMTHYGGMGENVVSDLAERITQWQVQTQGTGEAA